MAIDLIYLKMLTNVKGFVFDIFNTPVLIQVIRSLSITTCLLSTLFFNEYNCIKECVWLFSIIHVLVLISSFESGLT